MSEHSKTSAAQIQIRKQTKILVGSGHWIARFAIDSRLFPLPVKYDDNLDAACLIIQSASSTVLYWAYQVRKRLANCIGRAGEHV